MRMQYQCLVLAVFFSRMGSAALDMCAVGAARAQGIPIVLIVEDDDHVSLIVSMTMKVRGYYPLAAKTVQEAEDAMAVLGSVNLALIDVNLKGEDGIALASRFRSDRAIPVVLMSGEFIGTQDVAGYNTLPKPLDKDQLTVVLARAMTPP